MTNAKAHVTYHSLSDHLVVLGVFDKVTDKKEKVIKKQTITNKIHYSNSLEKINKINWMQWISDNKSYDIDTVYNSFHDIIQESTVFESKKINKKKSPVCPWMDQNLLDKKRKMEIARRKFLKKK